jgi:DNA-binding MarR family transcriptional regulator
MWYDIGAIGGAPVPQRQAKQAMPLGPDDYRLLAEFRHLLRQFLAFSEEKATEIGLSAQQHQALLAIKSDSGGAPTVGHLAKRLLIRHNSAVGLVDRLVQGGYAIRRPDPTDGRRVTLALTKRSEVILEKLTAAHRDELRNMAPLLKPLLAQLQD